MGQRLCRFWAAIPPTLVTAPRARLRGSERAEQADGDDQADAAFRLPRELANLAERKAKMQAAREVLKAKEAAKAQSQPRINLTDPDSGLMPQRKGGFVQGYNAQLAVEAHGIIVGQTVSTATNDRVELTATAATIVAEPGEVEYVVADEGYDNQPQITAVEQSLDVNVVCPPQRSTRDPADRCTHARAQRVALRTKRARFAHSPAGRELLYQRQTTIEPVFGDIKHNLGFRAFRLRGLGRVRTEWTLLSTAYNCRQLWRHLRDRN